MKNFNLNASTEANRKAIVNNIFIECMKSGISEGLTGIKATFGASQGVATTKVTLIYRYGAIVKELTSPVSQEVINCIIEAVQGNFQPIQAYEEKDEPALIVNDNFKLQMIEDFIKCSYRATIGDDFITKNGDRLLNIKFKVAYYQEFYFFIKRTEEVEALLDKYLTTESK
ncbi:hypothetical protein [Bacteroides sp.]